jgi:hypothetical protein
MKRTVFEAFPDNHFKMIGQDTLDIALHGDIRERPRREYDQALKHIRMTTRPILPDEGKKRLTDKVQLYDETYAPATQEEIEEALTEAQNAQNACGETDQPFQRSSKANIEKALEFLFGGED